MPHEDLERTLKGIRSFGAWSERAAAQVPRNRPFFGTPESGSLDHFISLKEERRGNRQAEGFRRLEIDHQSDFSDT
jgi:hypothetical protein